MFRHDERVKSCLCPRCGALLDAATRPVDDGSKAGEGDFSMCLHCGAALRWKADMTLKLATDEDLKELPEAEQALMLKLRIAQAVIIGRDKSKPVGSA